MKHMKVGSFGVPISSWGYGPVIAPF